MKRLYSILPVRPKVYLLALGANTSVSRTYAAGSVRLKKICRSAESLVETEASKLKVSWCSRRVATTLAPFPALYGGTS